MKKLLFSTLIFLSFVLSGLAQSTYYPMIHEDDDQQWNVLYITEPYHYTWGTEIQFIEGDSIIDGIAYKQAWRKNSDGTGLRIKGFVREESKRVYSRLLSYYNGDYVLGEEVLLYDFNLTEGDTVTTVGEAALTLIVIEESEVEVNGTMRRQLGLGGEPWPFGSVYEYWIEGVGSTYGFLNSGSETICGSSSYLLCYHENDDLIWDNEEFDSCVLNSNGNTNCWDGTIADSYAGGNGTEENPYQIATAEQLALLAEQTDNGTGGDAHYILTDDICLNSAFQIPWKPIGRYFEGQTSKPFTGVFDGNGHKVYDMKISDALGDDAIGLFGYTIGATIKNVIIENSTLNHVAYSGFVVGFAKNTDLSNCTIDGLASYNGYDDYYIGGIVGYLEIDTQVTDTVYLKKCINNATIRASITDTIMANNRDYSVGGIIGYLLLEKDNVFVIEDCVNHGEIQADLYAGGIVGHVFLWNKSVIKHCDNYGNITARFAGGILGVADGSGINNVIEACVNHTTGEVKGMSIGGIVGYGSHCSVSKCVNNASITGVFKYVSPNSAGGIASSVTNIANCYNTGNISFTCEDCPDCEPITINIGGVAGSIDNGECRNVYNSGQISEITMAGVHYIGIISGFISSSAICNNLYWLGDYDIPLTTSNVTPEGSCAFRPGATPTSWVLDEAQYGTTDLVKALNYGSNNNDLWFEDLMNINNGLPIIFRDEMLPLIGAEWYYEILNDDGSITYQYLQHTSDTTIQDEPVQIIVKINTLYDKGEHIEKSYEYIYERDGKIYWWNKVLEEFTVLYDYNAQVGDEWEIKVGTQSLVMHVDAVELYEYEGRQYKILLVSDEGNLFSGMIVCGIGHLTSFFPEKLINQGKGYRVEGVRCFWQDGELVFKYGDRDCDEVYEEFHDYGMDEPAITEGFKIYPNPTDGIIVVETQCIASLQNGQTEYRITNLMGQTLMTGRITEEVQKIDVSVLQAGIYFITFVGETQKIIINR